MTTANQRVDVGVVTYNTAALTTSALRELLDSNQGVDLRILVHDNASRDGTPDRLREEVPEAEVVESDANVGFAAGVNQLLARSDAPWFLALNSDAWPRPECLGRLVDVAAAHPRAALVVPRLEQPDGTLEHSTHPFPSLTVSLALATGLVRVLPRSWAERRLLHGAWAHDASRQIDWAVGAAWLMRRSAVDEIGGLDERFFMYAEDIEWCWRANQHGWEIWFEPAGVVVHVGNASGAGAYGGARSQAFVHNTDRFLADVRGRPYALAYRWINALGCARRALVARARGDAAGAQHRWTMASAFRRAPAGTDIPASARS